MSDNITSRASRKESLTTIHKSAITDSGQEPCHWLGEAKFIGTDQDRFKRWIKEATAIRKIATGQYFLPHILDEILINKHPIGKSTGNTKNIDRRQSSISSQ